MYNKVFFGAFLNVTVFSMTPPLAVTRYDEEIFDADHKLTISCIKTRYSMNDNMMKKYGTEK